MKKRKFADGGETTDTEPSEKPEGGRFSSDIYKRAYAQVNKSGEDSSKPTTKAKPAAKAKSDPTAGNARVGQREADFVDSDSDKSKRYPSQADADYARITKPGRDAIEGVYPETMLIGGLGAAASRALAGARAGAKAASETAAAKAFSTPRAVESAKSAQKYSPKQELEAGTSALRGAANRASIRAKRSDAEAGAPKGSSFKDSPSRKSGKTSFGKDDADFKRGGKVKNYAKGGAIDGIAQRGKTKGKVC